MGINPDSESHYASQDDTVVFSVEPEQRNATVYVVDSDSECRAQLRDWLTRGDMDVVEFDTVDEFLDASRVPDTACMLVDVSASDADGPAIHSQLRAACVPFPILFLIGPAEVEVARESFRRGCDFISKPVHRASLRARVHRALEIEGEKRAERQRYLEMQQRVDSLSDREYDVMLALLEKDSYAELARRLGLNATAAAHHAVRVFEKMMVSSDAELIRLVQSVGLPRRSVS